MRTITWTVGEHRVRWRHGVFQLTHPRVLSTSLLRAQAGLTPSCEGGRWQCFRPDPSVGTDHHVELNALMMRLRACEWPLPLFQALVIEAAIRQRLGWPLMVNWTPMDDQRALLEAMA